MYAIRSYYGVDSGLSPQVLTAFTPREATPVYPAPQFTVHRVPLGTSVPDETGSSVQIYSVAPFTTEVLYCVEVL